MRTLCASLLLAAATWPAIGCTVISCHDGDTCKLRCDGEALNVRLFCIDAPETWQDYGKAAQLAALQMIGQAGRVELTTIGRDRYGRTIGDVLADGKSVSLALVEQGAAAVYTAYCHDPAFYAAEGRARAAGRGIWATEGEHRRPWQARAAKRR